MIRNNIASRNDLDDLLISILLTIVVLVVGVIGIIDAIVIAIAIAIDYFVVIVDDNQFVNKAWSAQFSIRSIIIIP